MKYKIKSVQELLDAGFYFDKDGLLVDSTGGDEYMIAPKLLHMLGQTVRDTRLDEFYWTEIIEKPKSLYIGEDSATIDIVAENRIKVCAYIQTTEYGFSLTVEETKQVIEKLKEIVKYKEHINETKSKGE